MSWETRRQTRRYYTRSRRIEGRIVREYIGGGVLGRAAAELDRAERKQRREDLERDRAFFAEVDQAAGAVSDICGYVEAITRAALTLAGYRRHNRGEWRRCRA